MLRKKAKASSGAGYTYMPIDASKPFRNYNIEQQAEMGQDRFRRQNGLKTLSPDNRGATANQLNGVITFQ